jgi:hypothetical protein
MKSPSFAILIAGALIILLLISLSSCDTVLPYNIFPSTIIGRSYSEGFSSMTDYGTAPSSAGGRAVTFSEDTKEGFEGSEIAPAVSGSDGCKKVAGFDGLICSATAANKPLDIYSQAEGKLDCPSYGSFNSKGPLCLNETQKKLLRTRGGNLTGADSTIGA